MVDYYETNILKLQLIIILTWSVSLAYLLVRKMLVYFEAACHDDELFVAMLLRDFVVLTHNQCAKPLKIAIM
jgi:hypothetical protein